jgi:hypothetical protein
MMKKPTFKEPLIDLSIKSKTPTKKEEQQIISFVTRKKQNATLIV